MSSLANGYDVVFGSLDGGAVAMVLRVHGVLRPAHGRQVLLSPFQPLHGRLPVLLCHSPALASRGERVRAHLCSLWEPYTHVAVPDKLGLKII